ncbi:conserved hypothetical protein [Xenorhabdus nematophila ATCC 19061]|nr:conserved hypothetical protein [Xenorhabdus nematophila ATCC 19061]
MGVVDCLPVRFIPVLTGNTSPRDLHYVRVSVYPRTYGEHHIAQPNALNFLGLSPYLRGTLASSYSPVALKVYPRTYGEHPDFFNLIKCHYGLSPYLRGTLPPPPAHQEFQRFIPVLTGNTAARSCKRATRRVYPRTYGEHKPLYDANAFCPGLSPYLRGTQII